MLGRFILAAAGGYLLGSLLFGWLIARARGIDIFSVGSGSAGATNVRRALGRGPAFAVFALDALKGAAAVGGAMLLPPPTSPAVPLTALVAALLGHRFSCFARFRGGKGVATAAGGFLLLAPVEVLIAAAVWISAFMIGRYVSLASILAALALAAAALALREPVPLAAGSALVAVFVIYSHRSNIARLLHGKEYRFSQRPPPL